MPKGDNRFVGKRVKKRKWREKGGRGREKGERTGERGGDQEDKVNKLFSSQWTSYALVFHSAGNVRLISV